MAATPEPAVAEVRVWDLPTRVFHWSLALAVTACLVTGEFDSILGAGTLEWHRRLGYAVLGLVAFRLVWGFAGGTHARFAGFVRGPREIAAYAKSLRGGAHPVTVGHNPLGGWSVVAMLAAVGLQATTGLFLVQEDYGFSGPLAKFVSNATSSRLGAIHEVNGKVIMALVALHLAAVIAHAVVWRENLAAAMVSGKKRLPGSFAQAATRGGGWAPFIAAAGAGLAIVAALVKIG